MYKLYTRPGSGGFVVEVALEQTGAPFECIETPRSAKSDPDFLKLSPLGQVPALTLPDGRTITESAAMCIFLSDAYPEAALGPGPNAHDRPEFLRWMLFMSAMLYPALMRYFFVERCTTDPNGLEAVRQAAIVDADRGFLLIEQALAGRDWLVGDSISIADVYLLMLAHWHPVADRPRGEWVNIVRLCETLKQRPQLARLNETHRFW